MAYVTTFWMDCWVLLKHDHRTSISKKKGAQLTHLAAEDEKEIASSLRRGPFDGRISLRTLQGVFQCHFQHARTAESTSNGRRRLTEMREGGKDGRGEPDRALRRSPLSSPDHHLLLLLGFSPAISYPELGISWMKKTKDLAWHYFCPRTVTFGRIT